METSTEIGTLAAALSKTQGMMKAAQLDGTNPFFNNSSERLQGLIVSGQIDRYEPDTLTLQDYKFTTSYSAQNGAKSEWIWQLNLLALLAKEGYATFFL
jgi:hypothetical protein